MKISFLNIILLFISTIFLSTVATAQLIKHSYRFYNNLLVSAPECGPALTQVQALGNCNPASTPGSFITDSLPYCGLNRTVYRNNLHWGLQYSNTDGTITNTYTIHLYVKNTSYGNRTWARIIDFSNGLSDAGIYYNGSGTNNRCLDFYPNGIVGACPYFNTSAYYLLTFTRNGLTNRIDVYVNNTLFTSYNDAGAVYTGVTGRPIYIYRDDQVVTCESAEANFAYLSFTNQYSSQATVNAVYNDICSIANSSVSADFSLSPDSSCDLSQNIAVTYTGDITAPGTGYTFNWNWDGGTIVSGSGMGPYTVNWGTPGTKNITLTVSSITCGNQNTKTKQLRLKSKSFATVTQSICQGQSYAGYTTAGVYVDTFIAANGCDSIRTLNLTVKPRSLLIINQSICQGQTYLGYTTTGVYADTFPIPNGCDSIRVLDLTVKTKLITTINQSICQGQTYLGHTTTGIYIDTFTAANGCDSIRTLQLTVKQKSFSTIPISICRGQSYAGYTTSGTYVDTFLAANGCDSIRTLNLTVNTYALVNRNIQICEGEKYFAGGINQTITGIYYDTIISNAGCGSIIKTNLVVNPTPAFNLGPDVQLCFGDSISLNPAGFTNYLWSNHSSTSILTIKMPGLYWGRVSNSYNCKTMDTIVVTGLYCKEIKIPNAFSPNNDGINDTWKIAELQYANNCLVEVFNRWGQLMYRSTGYSKAWDGTYKGTKVPVGTYYYLIHVPELKQRFTGWVFIAQ